MMDEKVLQKYRKEIRKQLIGSRQEKDEYMEGWQERVNDYIERHPDCTIEQLREEFNDPEFVGEDFLAAVKTDTVKADAKSRKRVRKIIIATAVVLLLIIGVYLLVEHIDQTGYRNGIFVETVSQDELPSGVELSPPDTSNARYY